MRFSASALLEKLSGQGIVVRCEGTDDLRIAAPFGTLSLETLAVLRCHKREVLVALRGETLLERPRLGWSAEDEAACTARCRYCGQGIDWGQVTYDSADHSNRRWVKLDPDGAPHWCRRATNSSSGVVESSDD